MAQYNPNLMVVQLLYNVIDENPEHKFYYF
jgi:hypothetical protein